MDQANDNYGINDVLDEHIDAMYPSEEPLEETSTRTDTTGGTKRALGDDLPKQKKSKTADENFEDAFDLGDLSISSDVFNADSNITFDSLSRGAKAASFISDQIQDADFVKRMFDLLLESNNLGVKIDIFKRVINKYELKEITLDEVKSGLAFRGTRDPLKSKIRKEVQSALVFFTAVNLFPVLRSVLKHIGSIESAEHGKSVKIHYKDNATPQTVKLGFLFKSGMCFNFSSLQNTFSKGHVIDDVSDLIVKTHLFSGFRPMVFKEVQGKEANERISFRFENPSKLEFDLGPSGSIPTPSSIISGALINAITEFGYKEHFHNRLLEVGTLGPFFLLACFKRIMEKLGGEEQLAIMLAKYEHNVVSTLQTLSREHGILFTQDVLVNEYKEVSQHQAGKHCIAQYQMFFGGIRSLSAKQNLFKFFALTKVVCDCVHNILMKSNFVREKSVDMPYYFKHAFKNNTLPKDRVLQIAQRLNQHRSIMKLDDISLKVHYEMVPDPHVRKVKGAMALEHVTMASKTKEPVIQYNFASKQIMEFVRTNMVQGTTYYLADDSEPERNILGTTEKSHFNEVIYNLIEKTCTDENKDKPVIVTIIGTSLKMTKISLLMQAFAGIKKRVSFNLAAEPYQFGQDEENFFIKTQFNDAYPSTYHFRVEVKNEKETPIRWFKLIYDPVERIVAKNNEERKQKFREAYNQVMRNFFKPMFDYVTTYLDLVFKHNLGMETEMKERQERVISRSLVLLKADEVAKDSERISNVEIEESMNAIFFNGQEPMVQ